MSALHTAQDQGEALVIAGRPGWYSEGLDQATFEAGGKPASELLHAATEMILRLVEFPHPVVTACTGTALGAAATCLLGCDYRIGAAGSYKIGMNYVALGMEVPDLAIEMARTRLSPRHVTLACNTAHLYSPEAAVEAGFLDAVTTGDIVEAAVATGSPPRRESRPTGLRSNPDHHLPQPHQLHHPLRRRSLADAARHLSQASRTESP